MEMTINNAHMHVPWREKKAVLIGESGRERSEGKQNVDQHEETNCAGIPRQWKWKCHLLQSFICPWNSPGTNTGMGNHSLLQGILLTQKSNLGLPPCRQILHHLSHVQAEGIASSKVLRQEYVGHDMMSVTNSWRGRGQRGGRYSQRTGHLGSWRFPIFLEALLEALSFYLITFVF